MDVLVVLVLDAVRCLICTHNYQLVATVRTRDAFGRGRLAAAVPFEVPGPYTHYHNY